MKPVFEISIAEKAPSPFAAHELLGLPLVDKTYHGKNGFRDPLGIYNISISRICEKTISLCTRLEDYFRATRFIDDQSKLQREKADLINHIELMLYTAAEHVDDLDSIAVGFFANRKCANNAAHFKKLQKEVAKFKRFISAVTNLIKHQQSRIRLCSIELQHGTHLMCLHGFSVEGTKNGIVGPNGSLNTRQRVYSIPTLVWEVLWFVLSCSQALKAFLMVSIPPMVGPPAPQVTLIGKAISAAVRLPNYTFGEEHPFHRTTLKLLDIRVNERALDSDLYGAFKNRWHPTAIPIFGRFTSEFQGDGSTQTFTIAMPKTVSLLHWQ